MSILLEIILSRWKLEFFICRKRNVKCLVINFSIRNTTIGGFFVVLERRSKNLQRRVFLLKYYHLKKDSRVGSLIASAFFTYTSRLTWVFELFNQRNEMTLAKIIEEKITLLTSSQKLGSVKYILRTVQTPGKFYLKANQVNTTFALQSNCVKTVTID